MMSLPRMGAVKTESDGINPGIRTVAGIQNLAFLCSTRSDRYPFLLESCTGEGSASSSTSTARFDILFAYPGERLALDSNGRLEGPFQDQSGSFINALDAWWTDNKRNAVKYDTDIPFRGGWFLYLSYELAEEIEPVLKLPKAGNNFPKAVAVRIPAAVINDHYKNTAYIISETNDENVLAEIMRDLEVLRENVISENTSMADNASRNTAKSSIKSQPADKTNPDDVTFRFIPSEESAEKYLNAAGRAVEYIYAGDVFQVNLSRIWRCDVPEDTSSHLIFASLKTNNPAPFSGLAVFPEFAIISSSPERLVRVNGKKIETRPIAGTRPRTEDENNNVHEKKYLTTNPKELSEHRMLIDLERNDLGKICIPGSVKIDENMIVEDFAHVHHIVSSISGTLQDGITPGKILKSVFPGGTITGCPKIRCMQIIAELEGEARGPYTGSMGYLNSDGDMDLNILIRTFVKIGSHLSFRAGAGIVADSVPEKELEETRAKAKGLILALENL